MTASTKSSFEDFLPRAGRDVFAAPAELAEHLSRHSEPCLDALGHQLLGAPEPRTTVRDERGHEQRMIMLGSNSFLNLATHPRVATAAKEAVDRYGYGMGAVPVYAGTSDLHRDLERRIAAFLEQEEAMLFPCGYSGNIGVLSALCAPGSVILNDVSNHASIFDGARLAGADVRIYLHRNMRHLEKQLRSIPDSQRARLIVTDGVFSMDGDLAPLDRICDLAERYAARVMVDDAHGIGVVGPSGRGTAEVFDCADRVHIHYGTLSKAPGGIGGYCAGSRDLIQYLKLYARPYFFSTSLPAPLVAALLEVFAMFAEDSAGRTQLWENIVYLTGGLRQAGFDLGDTRSAIVPVWVRDESILASLHRDLRRAGVFTNIVTFPAVRRKACRLRLNVMAGHTREDLDTVIRTLTRLGAQYGLVSPGAASVEPEAGS